jgi:hypothetical protein
MECQRDHANEAIEKLMGPGKPVTKEKVLKAIKSGAGRAHIGTNRAVKIWGWVASHCGSKGKYRTSAPKGTNQNWITSDQRTLMRARADAAWAQGSDEPDTRARAEKLEVKQTLRRWITQHEAPAREGKPQVLRHGRLNQLLMATKNALRDRGGRAAAYAGLALLEAAGAITLEITLEKPHSRGKWKHWRRDTLDQMALRGWFPAQDPQPAPPPPTSPKYEWLVLDVGEGWGSVGQAIRETQRDARVVGVDIRGHTQTGSKHGVITAEIQHDLAAALAPDHIRAISKKAGVTITRWGLIWLSSECLLFTSANAINQASGTAHGIWAQTEMNKANAKPGRTAHEAELLKTATRAIYNQLDALEAHPLIPFAWESPRKSEVWNLVGMKQMIQANPGWRKVEVDQCAYGREAMKPTTILTNMTPSEWTPKGRTGTGRCKVGACAGTPHGEPRHLQQTATTRPGARTTKGDKKGTRRDFTRDAAVNAVASELVQEIAAAARSRHR